MSELGKKALKVAQEQIEVEHRLRKKYPQMYKKDWGKKEEKSNWATRLKSEVKKRLSPKKTVRTSAVERGLKKAGIGDKKINKLGGR